ncbi:MULTISPECIES: HAD family hydrolase [Pseudonocardia]|uniref:Phosphoglycolate phosphatase n=2 Tax=Pseudonocardia TaxID=1847 RepID=A0A1Y2N3N3_PSEAH|nr:MULTISPECIES: HAD family phosphatase [Pseudonocardia]OSY41498.1 Phosphoglycolate phosphatase [Pseudonocardia autotrophica]TDN71453.1 HAD superfamily hydrolase (TIGR01509 family) [Pseudonocardia autotrophica]BBG02129.1 putative hydrolase [Pseudonocardia autotrophica]GEC24143.1 putative hydrolase [Pseudonocardia saturnea]
MRELRGVLLDMDGTLIDSEKVWEVALNDLMKHLGSVPLPVEARLESVGGSLDSSLRICFREAGRDPATVPADEYRETGEWLYSRAGELFAHGVPWRPGARELLVALRAEGIPAALVTNTIRVLVTRALDTLGAEHFAAIVPGDEVSEPKPGPEPYLRGAELLGLDPADCVAVEDSPTGARSAERAGCAVLVVPCELEVPAGERRVQRSTLSGVTPADLDGILREVRARA